MTIYCVAAWPGIPSVRPCLTKEHLTECESDTCRGCYPATAQYGYLCEKHWWHVQGAYTAWIEWAALVERLDGAPTVKRVNVGSASKPDGYANLDPVWVAVDEIRGHLASLHGRLEQRVYTEAGARDAVLFARAVERAVKAHPVTEKRTVLRRSPCDCGGYRIWEPPAWVGADVTVTCTDCDMTLTQDEYELLPR